MISTTLTEWLRTGKLGPLGPRSTADELVAILGVPPLAGPHEGRPVPGYWLYGEVEFGIDDSGVITYVQTDTVNIGRGATSPLRVDWQGLRHGATVAEATAWLVRGQLAHEIIPDGDETAIKIGNSAELLLFGGASEPELFTILTPPRDQRG